MKNKAWLSALVLILAMVFFECTGYSETVTNESTDKVLSTRTNESVQGIVEIATDSKVYLVMKWKTRSRVPLEVIGKLTKKVAALKGKVIRARGIVVKTGDWSGTIDVIEIIQNNIRERAMSNRKAIFETTMGNFTVELFEDKAPITTKNFIDLAQKGFYNGIIFHRVIDGFMIQTGDPQGTGTGGPGYTIKDEFHKDLRHSGEGILSMANTGRPNTGGSQFFITLAPTTWLDDHHAVFGKVIEGIEVVRNIGKVKTGPGDRPVTEIKIKELKIVD